MKCPECWNDLPAQSAFCLHCGHEIASTRASPRQVVPIEPPRSVPFTSSPTFTQYKSYQEAQPASAQTRLGVFLLGVLATLCILFLIGTGVMFITVWQRQKTISTRAIDGNTPALNSPPTPAATIRVDPSLFPTAPRNSPYNDPKSQNTEASLKPITGGGVGQGGSSIDYNRTFKTSEVTRKAQILNKPEPFYTEAARKNQVSGTVRLRLILSASGQVEGITPLSSLPDGLTEKAVEAARKISFTPAEKDGRKVSQYVTIEYNFNIY